VNILAFRKVVAKGVGHPEFWVALHRYSFLLEGCSYSDFFIKTPDQGGDGTRRPYASRTSRRDTVGDDG